MKNKFRYLALFALIASAFVFSSCNKNFELSVSLQSLDKSFAADENPIKVSYGQDAVFSVEPGEGKEITAVACNGRQLRENEYLYKDGLLTVYRITEPSTLMVSLGKNSEKCIFEIKSNASRGGGASSVPTQGRVAKGTVVTFSASPNDGAVFLGWSSNKPISNGGKLLSKKEQYTSTISSDTTIYANYDASKVKSPVKKPSVIPDIPTQKPSKPQGNGMWQPPRNEFVNLKYIDGETEFVTDFCTDFYSMPNTLPENGKFVKEGFVPTGYSLDGQYVGFGHKFLANGEESVLEILWQEAESAESFTYSVTSDKIKIEKYIGNSDKIYIPKTINGLPVVQIGEGAFDGCGASYIYIPSTVVNIADGAFSNCKKLSEITLFDSVQKISDKSFEGSLVKTVNLHASTQPKYTDSDLMFGKKYERFMTAENNRIILISGSSKHYGFDSDYADTLSGGKYTFVNYGTNAQMNVMFYLEAMANLANEGDIILLAPEQYGPYCDTVNGKRDMTALTFQGSESCYQLVSAVDASQYTGFFNALNQYLSQRISRKDLTYESRSYKLDEYGDCSVARKNYNSDGYRNGANGTFYFKKDTIPSEFAENFNRILSIASSRNIPAYLSFPPYNINACDPNTLNDASYDEYMADMEKTINATLVSDVRDYIIEGKYFYNTDYHLMEEGAKHHTEVTVRDIMTALDAERSN